MITITDWVLFAFVSIIAIIFLAGFAGMQREINDLRKQLSAHEHWEE